MTRTAKSLETLRAQVNAMAPGRSIASDGTLGDERHRHTTSDHNPNKDDVVTAMDITHDPSHGVDAGQLAETLRLSKDSRIKYVISNRRIFSSQVSPWEWRPYNGLNAHTQHVHVSVVADKAAYDDTRPWMIDRVAVVREPLLSKRCDNIVATVFGGVADPNNSAYDSHFITDTELGVALPDRFTVRPLPKIRVTNPLIGKSVICEIVDVGPWNTNDPYWQTNLRPQAESGIDLSGRRTNLAGIDLTPAAARAIGIDGKGRVNWEFAGVLEHQPQLPEVAITDPVIIRLKQRIEELEATIAGQPGGIKIPKPATEIPALLQQLLTVLDARAKAAGVPLQTEQIRKAIEMIGAIVAPGKPPALGQVNGALGQTIGNLLDGKKTAIGMIGSLVTSLLSNVPDASSTGLSKVIIDLTTTLGVGGLSKFAMPFFLVTTAWGVLGKLEKWAQGTAPPPETLK